MLHYLNRQVQKYHNFLLNMNFFKFIIRWVGSNLAVPFWVVGHIHLSVNIYQDIYEILSSFGMNIIVIWALWLDWKDSNKVN